MDFLSLLSGPISALVEKFGDYKIKGQENKENKSRRLHEFEEAKHLAKVDRIKRGDVAEMDYDRLAQENAKNSIIDEIMIAWVLVLVTLLFIPATAPYAITGFTVLSAETPVFFQTIFVGIFVSKLGLRFLFSGRTLFGKTVK